MGTTVDLVISVDGIELRCSSIGDEPTIVLIHSGGEQRRV